MVLFGVSLLDKLFVTPLNNLRDNIPMKKPLLRKTRETLLKRFLETLELFTFYENNKATYITFDLLFIK